jgi:hypothetical protein
VEVNDIPVPVRIVGTAAEARSGLTMTSCAGAIALEQGSNTVRAVPGLDTGIDIDRVVLSSGATGRATPPATLGTPLDQSGATVRVVDSSPDSYALAVQTDGTPFWLVLGESNNAGWDASASAGSVGKRQLVDGFANGWLVTPRGAGTFAMELRWTPQRLVWLGLAVSVVAALLCVVLVFLGWRRRAAMPPGADALADQPAWWSPFEYPGTTPSTRALVALAVGAAIGTAVFSRPWIGIVVGVAALVAATVARGRILLTAGAPLALAFARITRFDDLAWLAVGLLAADLVTWWLRERRRRRETATASPGAT